MASEYSIASAGWRREHETALTYVARAGYAARGAVYVLIGVFALMAAFGSGETESTRGALGRLLGTEGGWILLIVLGAGLFGYALWRFLQAFLDVDGKGTDAKGVATRIGYAVSGLIHVALGVYAIGLGVGSRQAAGGGGDGLSQHAAWLMQQPYGRWLVGIVGAIIIIVAFAFFFRAYYATFKKRLDMPPDTLRKVTPVCRFGIAARAFVFLVIGGLLVYAGYRANPEAAGGMQEALQTIHTTTYGQWLLAIVALGLVAYALFTFIQAGYRRIVID